MQNSSCFVNGSWLAFNKSCVRGNGAGSVIYSKTYILTSTLLLSVLIPVIVIGNAFVISAFMASRRLRTTTNYFVLSLAVTDILIGSLSLPIFTAAITKGQSWRNEHPIVNQLWTAVDMVTAIASIVNLMYISVDRYICIQYPLKYHTLLSKTKVKAAILVSWLYGVLGYCLLNFTSEKQRPRPEVMLLITVMAFALPLVVVIVMCVKVGKIALSHSVRMRAFEERNDIGKTKRNKGTVSLLRELKATRTLAVVITAFVVCWVGYFFYILRTSICLEWDSLRCRPLNTELSISIQWVKYFNSSLNPFIYAAMNGDMRNAMKRFVGRKLTTTSTESSSEMRDRPSQCTKVESS